MKKYAVIMIALLIMLIGGCSAGNKSLSDGSSENSVIYNSSASEDDVKYTYVCAQYIYYNTADELMKACDIVMSGKVTGISFTVRDGRTNDDVVVAFSFSGTTDVVAASVKAAKRQGASVIAITGNPDSIIGRCADFCLRTPAIERKVRIGAVSSRYSQQFICDLIFLCLISKHYEEAEELTLKASNLLSYIL